MSKPTKCLPLNVLGKSVTLAICLRACLAFLASDANAATIEPGVTIGVAKPIGMAAVDEAVNLIRLYGYRCDSVSWMTRYLMSTGFTIRCNQNQYTYEITDKGGNWVVELDD